jgi:UDP-glucuronate decarboxylase
VDLKLLRVAAMAIRTLVTGGAGFLGSHLCDRLIQEGHEVICLDNFFTGRRSNLEALLGHPAFQLVREDVTLPLRFEVDEIYHLACPASPVHYQSSPVRTVRTAVEGTYNVLELARRTGARVLIASTSEIYGDPKEHPQREEYWGHVNPIGPRACYDEGKRCAETLAMGYAAEHRVRVYICRIFNTYGPRLREDDGRVVSNFIVQALRNEPLTVYGNGDQTRSFCYVSDLIEGFRRLIASDEVATPVNLGNPRETSVRALAQLVKKLTNSAAAVIESPLPQDDPGRRKPDITRAIARLGWNPTVNLEEGLRRTIEEFRRRLSPCEPRDSLRGRAGLAQAVGG